MHRRASDAPLMRPPQRRRRSGRAVQTPSNVEDVGTCCYGTSFWVPLAHPFMTTSAGHQEAPSARPLGTKWSAAEYLPPHGAFGRIHLDACVSRLQRLRMQQQVHRAERRNHQLPICVALHRPLFCTRRRARKLVRAVVALAVVHRDDVVETQALPRRRRSVRRYRSFGSGWSEALRRRRGRRHRRRGHGDH